MIWCNIKFDEWCITLHTQIDMHKRSSIPQSKNQHQDRYSYNLIFTISYTVKIQTQEGWSWSLLPRRGQYRFQDYDTTQSTVEGTIRASGCLSEPGEFSTFIFTLAWPILFSHEPKNVPNIPKLQSWSHRSHDQSWSTQVSQNVSISIPDISRLWYLVYLVILDGCHQIRILQLHAGTHHDHTVQHRPGIQWFEELSLYAEQLLSLGRWFGKALAILFGGMNCGTSSYQHPVRDDELADPFQRPCLRRCLSLLYKQRFFS